jgi:RND family efflux transporter MFP subunit
MQTTTRNRVLLIAAIGLGLAALAFALASWDAGGSPAGLPSAVVKRGDVRITLSESGELRAEHQATIQATNDKMIVWMAAEGSFVKQGELLVQLDSSKYEIQRSSADSGLQMAKAQLESAFSDLEQHKNAEQQAKLEYEKLPELAEKGYINRNEVATARLAYEKVLSARRSYEAAVVAAQANVERAAQEVNQSQLKYDLGSIRAPRDGLVVYARVGDPGANRKVDVGMTPFEGQDLMYLPDLSSMIVETEISEVDLSRVRVGSPAELRLDAYPDLSFRGEVAVVSGLARRKISKVTGKPTGLKVFDVTIKVLDRDERLRPGLTTTTEILVSDYRDALYVPVAAVFLDELDQTIAYLRRLGRIEPVPIVVADSSDRVAIVSEGLEEGQELLLEIPERL